MEIKQESEQVVFYIYINHLVSLQGGLKTLLWTRVFFSNFQEIPNAHKQIGSEGSRVQSQLFGKN